MSLRCCRCGADTILEERDDPVEYRGHRKAVQVLGHWCPACGEAVFGGATLLLREQAYLALKAEVDQKLDQKLDTGEPAS